MVFEHYFWNNDCRFFCIGTEEMDIFSTWENIRLRVALTLQMQGKKPGILEELVTQARNIFYD